MEDWSFIESRFDDLANQLETAKQHIVKVPVDFKTRYRIWRDQVVKDRLMQLRKDPIFDVAVRYYDLTLRDYVRLNKRATKEFFKVVNDVEITQATLRYAQLRFQRRNKDLMTVHNNFLNEMLEIINKR